MLLRSHCPYYRPGHVRLAQRQPAGPLGQRPPALWAKLTTNALMPDEATDRSGNCGIDAFADGSDAGWPSWWRAISEREAPEESEEKP